MAIDRDSRWVWAGLAFSIALLVAFLGYWTSWFGLTAATPTPAAVTSESGGGPTTAPSPSGRRGASDRSLEADLVQFALPAALVGGVVVWIGLGLRDRRPRFDRLPAEEQARRREAGRILREVVPPVSEEEARRMLALPWERGPDGPPATTAQRVPDPTAARADPVRRWPSRPVP